MAFEGVGINDDGSCAARDRAAGDDRRGVDRGRGADVSLAQGGGIDMNRAGLIASPPRSRRRALPRRAHTPDKTRSSEARLREGIVKGDERYR
jgi:hypothetical protein